MKKSRTSAALAEAGHEENHDEGNTPANVVSIETGHPPGENKQSDEPVAPPRLNGEVQQCVDSAASTITGCTESEMKNFLATGDFLVRQVALMLANRWKEVCRTAEFNAGSDGEKAAKVGLSIKVDIDQSNLLLMDTKVKMGFTRKYSEVSETQEDLRQVQFKLQTA